MDPAASGIFLQRLPGDSQGVWSPSHPPGPRTRGHSNFRAVQYPAEKSHAGLSRRKLLSHRSVTPSPLTIPHPCLPFHLCDLPARHTPWNIHPSTQLAQVVSSHILSPQTCPWSLSHVQTSSARAPPGLSHAHQHQQPGSQSLWPLCSTKGEPQRAKDHPRLQCGKDTPSAKPHPRDFTPPHPPASSPAWWPLTRKGWWLCTSPPHHSPQS